MYFGLGLVSLASLRRHDEDHYHRNRPGAITETFTLKAQDVKTRQTPTGPTRPKPDTSGMTREPIMSTSSAFFSSRRRRFDLDLQISLGLRGVEAIGMRAWDKVEFSGKDLGKLRYCKVLWKIVVDVDLFPTLKAPIKRSR